VAPPPTETPQRGEPNSVPLECPIHGNQIHKELLRKRELALMLGISERTIENWLASKLIPRLRLSPRLTRFSLPRVLAALNRYEVREAGGRK
jgi:predicted DNA-binding transcriptional regulator AlpA